MDQFDIAIWVLDLKGCAVLTALDSIFRRTTCRLADQPVKVLQIFADKGPVSCFVYRVVYKSVALPDAACDDGQKNDVYEQLDKSEAP